jgi:hypothetical protein
MKTLELEGFGLQELDRKEMQTNGGWWQAALAIVGAAIYIYNNAGDLADGFSEGRADYYK